MLPEHWVEVEPRGRESAPKRLDAEPVYVTALRVAEGLRDAAEGERRLEWVAGWSASEGGVRQLMAQGHEPSGLHLQALKVLAPPPAPPPAPGGLLNKLQSWLKG
ncbi:MAG: hypothetical protein H6740_25965 [Alphaproteobacteria bacterium]|nr:hypothetical protein [Alphaproteobacteria bacterium]